MAEVKVLGAWSSPFSRKVEMCLKIKGVEYEYVEEDLSNKSPLLLESNPVYKKVPVLIHNGKPIAESSIIIEYIDEAFDGPSILPKDPYERAKARFWVKFMDDKCLPQMWKSTFTTGEEGQKAKAEAIETLTFLENEIKGKKFFGGDNIGFVDIGANFLALYQLLSEELKGLSVLTEDKLPNLYRWADELISLSIVKENLPPKEKMAEKLKPHIDAARAASK